MFNTIKNALKTPDVRKKVLYTLLLIVIFRLGCYITVPGVDSFKIAEAFEGQGIASLIDMLSGGAFHRYENGVNDYIDLRNIFRWQGTVILMRIPVVLPEGFNYIDYLE